MKNQTKHIIKKSTGITLIMICFLGYAITSFGQDDDTNEKDKRPVRSPFESALLIDNQTVVVPSKKTLEFDIQHRFGTVENNFSDLFGFYAPSNIRLGFTYTIVDNLAIGFGTTKFSKQQDFNLKYAIIKQTRSGSFPVSATYFANTVIDARGKDEFDKSAHRISFFHQLLISRKFNSKLTFQVAPSFSHYNAIDTLMNNDVIAVSAIGRYKVSPQMAVIFDYDHQITKHDAFDLQPNISIGIEVATSSHAFQVFAGSFQRIVPQYNMMNNANDFGDGNILIGFNITRLWNF